MPVTLKNVRVSAAEEDDYWTAAEMLEEDWVVTEGQRNSIRNGTLYAATVTVTATHEPSGLEAEAVIGGVILGEVEPGRWFSLKDWVDAEGYYGDLVVQATNSLVEKAELVGPDLEWVTA